VIARLQSKPATGLCQEQEQRSIFFEIYGQSKVDRRRKPLIALLQNIRQSLGQSAIADSVYS
jgi:hypothetical protein